jgi:hypothetical protein
MPCCSPSFQRRTLCLLWHHTFKPLLCMSHAQIVPAVASHVDAPHLTCGHTHESLCLWSHKFAFHADGSHTRTLRSSYPHLSSLSWSLFRTCDHTHTWLVTPPPLRRTLGPRQHSFVRACSLPMRSCVMTRRGFQDQRTTGVFKRVSVHPSLLTTHSPKMRFCCRDRQCSGSALNALQHSSRRLKSRSHPTQRI